MTSIVAADAEGVVVEATQQKTCSLFSFATDGRFRWWSALIIALLAIFTVASISVLSTISIRRPAPTALRRVADAFCPWLSPALAPMAFTLWYDNCPSVRPGEPYICGSQADCVILGQRCASSVVLAHLRCVHGKQRNHTSYRYCALDISSDTVNVTVVNGFCTAPNHHCALCVGSQCNNTLISCILIETCSEDDTPWRCAL